MPFNPYASLQTPDASRMPQVGFGQSNPSPQYGGTPNQNAFDNANSAANLTARFGTPAAGAPSSLPGGAPTSSPMGVPFGGRPTPQNYGGPMFANGQPPYGGRPDMMTMQGFAPYNRFGPPPQNYPYSNLMAKLQATFPQLNYLPYMTPYANANPFGYAMPPQTAQLNALLGPR